MRQTILLLRTISYFAIPLILFSTGRIFAEDTPTMPPVEESLGQTVSKASPPETPKIEWTDLPFDASMNNFWQSGCEHWIHGYDVTLDPENSSALIVQPGDGVLVSTLQGRANFRNLSSKQQYGNIEAQVEFLLSEGSNGGVKLQELYEIQIRDTYGKKNPGADDCGGIYPRAELKPKYHLIDQGVPPQTNAAKPAGQWQSLHLFFQSPKFDAKGKKTANAKFLKVVLNGKIIHENVELKWPTGHAWRIEAEVAKGAFYLQGDHGPIAYRNVRIRPLFQDEK